MRLLLAEDEKELSNALVAICGGTFQLLSGGDGIHADTQTTISGGKIYVSGPASGADGALGYDGEAASPAVSS